MDTATTATHAATGCYRVTPVTDHPTHRFALVGPNGAEHGTHPDYLAAYDAYRTLAELPPRPAGDAATLAEIRALVAAERAYDDDGDPDDIEVTTYRAIRDLVLGAG